MKPLPPRSQSHGPAKDRSLVGDAVILRGERIPLRLLKDHGVTHVVACCPPTPETAPETVTACRGVSDVPWSRTSKFKPSKIDCMGCLVALACGAKPSGASRTRSWRTLDGARHEMRLDDPKLVWHAPCGADLIEARVARKAPNCAGCRTAKAETQRVQEGRDRGRQLPRTARR